MKFRTETRTRTVMHGPAGQERPLTESFEVRVPVLPRDWDSIAIKVATYVVLALTLASVIWSTVSIGALLHGVAGYAAAAVFDMAWLVNVLLEWLARNSPRKRTFAKRLGWALLVVTMGAIAWHGLLAGGLAMAVVGAAVSAFAKLLWMGIMRFINRDLSGLDQQWVEKKISEANAELAVAGVERLVSRQKALAALELVAAEKTRQEVAGLMDPEAGPEPVKASAEVVSDAVTPRRRGAVSPSGEEADVRPELEKGQASDRPEKLVIRPEDIALLRELLADHDAQADEAELDDEEEEEVLPRPSLASAVRTLVDKGVTDPKVVGAAVVPMIGRTPKAESVARELRAAKSKLSKALGASDGLYL